MSVFWDIHPFLSLPVAFSLQIQMLPVSFFCLNPCGKSEKFRQLYRIFRNIPLCLDEKTQVVCYTEDIIMDNFVHL